MSNLFQQFSAAQQLRIPCALQPNTEVIDPKTGKPVLVIPAGSEPIFFDLQAPTSDQVLAADAVLHAAVPPRLSHEESRPGTLGPVKVDDGPDWESPEYIQQRQQLLPKRNAYLCLYGCPMLMETTPGNDIEEKALTLLRSIGAFALLWMADKLENMSMFTGVGEAEVALFLAEKSGGAPSSSGSSSASPRKKKRKPLNGSTAPRSTTKKGK